MSVWKHKKLAHVQNSSAFSVFAVYVRHLDNYKLHWTAWAIFQVLVLGLICTNARAQNTVGTVTALTGTAHVERGGATQPVTNGMQVELKDKFTA